jgi:hypothetical protein
MEPVSFEFALTPKDYSQALRAFQLKNTRLWIVFFAFCVPLFLCEMSAVLRGEFGSNTWLATITFLLPVGIVIFLVFLTPLLTARQAGKIGRASCRERVSLHV